MLEAPNILKATASSDGKISIQFENGIKADFNFEKYFTYTGYYAFLSDLNIFTNIHFNGNYIYWINESSEEIEIDSSILYSICTQEKIVVDGKVVFDPSLGLKARLLK